MSFGYQATDAHRAVFIGAVIVGLTFDQIAGLHFFLGFLLLPACHVAWVELRDLHSRRPLRAALRRMERLNR